MKSRTDQYGSVAVTIHWLSAFAVLILLGSGFGAANTLDPSAKQILLQLHVPLAITVLVLTLARIFWWWLADRKPKPISGTPAWQDWSARTVHVLLYIVLFVLFGSGFALLAASGAGNVLFGGSGELPDFTQYAPRGAHGLAAIGLVLLLAAHVAAALYHEFIRKDGIFRRMWYGRVR